MDKWPETLDPALLGHEIFEWRHHHFTAVKAQPVGAMIAQAVGKEAVECDSVTTLMSYLMDEPYWDTEDLENVKLTMRVQLAKRVQNTLAGQGKAIRLMFGTTALDGPEDAPELNLFNDRTMIADLIALEWLSLSEREDSAMLRGDALKDRRWGGCMFCAHRESDSFCPVFRTKRADLDPAGVVCVDFYPTDVVKTPSAAYVPLRREDVFIPRYTAMVTPQPFRSQG